MSPRRTIMIGAAVFLCGLTGCPASASTGSVTVPDATGMTRTDANLSVTGGVGFVVGEVTQKQSAMAVQGEVICQAPAAGVSVAKGTPGKGEGEGEKKGKGEGEGEGELTAGTLRTFANIEFVWCPPGTFMMGRYSGEQDSNGWEEPQHKVTIARGFWMSKYECTQAQWAAVIGSNPAHFSYYTSDVTRPVEQVSWNMIAGSGGFLDTLNAANPGMHFRLPSDAEWEYACRAGTTTRFYWGDDPSYTEIDRYAWSSKNSESKSHAVGEKLPNPWGLYDMSGNVWEWCQDWWHDDYTGAPSDGSAWDLLEGSGRVLRGGSWSYTVDTCRSAARGNDNPTHAPDNRGFRIVRTP